MKRKVNDLIFIIVMLLISLACLVKFIKNSNVYNKIDNRMSYRFSLPSLSSFLSGDYQSQIDEVISDQMPKFGWFKLFVTNIKNKVNVKTITQLLNVLQKDKYIKFKGINLFNGYMVFDIYPENNFYNLAADDVSEINKIYQNTNANVYFYFIETDLTVNFETKQKIDLVNYFNNNLELKKENISFFDVSSFDDFRDNFFHTDHHWNYRGSYKGYTEIAKMMNYDKILTPTGSVCFNDAKFQGSKNYILSGTADIKDIACLYEFDYPSYKFRSFDAIVDDYLKDNETIQKMETITYNNLYGYDEKNMIIYNNDSENDKKLLIYSNSYANALRKLLAANYKETHIIDGRHYSEKSMVDYINDNNIDDVLIVANTMLLWDEKNW